MTFTDIITEATTALLAVVPETAILAFVGAGVALAIAARFGGRLTRMGR